MQARRMVCVNVGCGGHPLPGFVNIDLGRGADIRRDVTKGLPFPDGSAEAIFSEHFLEHLARRDGLSFLRECRRVLRPGGALRIAMPDLDELVARYSSEDWRGDGDMFRMGFEWVENRCEMMNLGMREWGHQWVYNAEELERCADLAGLTEGRRMPWGASDHPKLNGLEYRAGSKLIMEFRKRGNGALGPPPLVSILIPAYNPGYFEAALRSALEQTFGKTEIVVCDDSADDRIERLVRSSAGADDRVKYRRNDPRRGPRDNYLECFALSRGDYVKFLNDDDVLEPGCVAAMCAALDSNPDATLAVCKRAQIEAEGRPAGRTSWKPSLCASDSLVEGGSLARVLLSLGANWVGEPTSMMFRRSDVAALRPDFLSFGGVAVPGYGDLALALNLLGKGNLVYLAEPLCRIRRHPEQRQRDPELRRLAADSVYLLRKHAARLGLYRNLHGMPDPAAWLAGFKYRRLGPPGPWKRRFPGPVRTMVFIKKCVDTGLWAYRRLARLRANPG